MDLSWGLKSCTVLRNGRTSGDVDRISCLTDELLSDILSYLPTKNAVATSVLSKRWRRVFTWITSLDFHHLQRCSHDPQLIDDFSKFKIFVDNTLRVCQTENLSQFKLRFGDAESCPGHLLVDNCTPYLKPMELNSWLSFLLKRRIRILDLEFEVKEPFKLPWALFTCETLEVLKLFVNLDLDHEVPGTIYLPNLKVFHLKSVRVSPHAFVNQLVSSCPSLEELRVQSWFRKEGDVFNILAPCLRTLFLDIYDEEVIEFCGDIVLDTPNLQYLNYSDVGLMRHYAIRCTSLVKAWICIHGYREDDDRECQSLLGLLKAVSNVKELHLVAMCGEVLQIGYFVDGMPMFHNLNTLHLGNFGYNQWHKLLKLLHFTPSLETLVFPEGIFCRNSPYRPACWEPVEEIPSCFESHLKKIVIRGFTDTDFELIIVQFLLENSFVLEELVVHGEKWAKLDILMLECKLHKIQRASIKCSVMIHLS